MNWLEIIRTFWPIVATLTPFILIGFILWLKSQFVLKAELETQKQRIDKAATLTQWQQHEERLDEGSRKLADLDKRVSLVEQDCESSPSKSDLNHGYATLAGRMSGVESSLRGLEKQLSTQNDYVHALLQKGLQG